MHHIVFVIYAGFELLDMSGPVSVFDGANHILAQNGRPAFYAIDITSADGGLVTSSSGVAVHSLRRHDPAPDEVDTLLIAPDEGDRSNTIGSRHFRVRATCFGRLALRRRPSTP